MASEPRARAGRKERFESERSTRRDEEDGLREGVGGFVDELAGNKFFGDALSRIVETGERVMHAQQSAVSALGLPSGSQFESLTLRVRTLFHRIEELEDDLDRLDRRVAALESAAASKSSARGEQTKPSPGAAKPKPKPAARAAKKS